jgi:hypothetical protein
MAPHSDDIEADIDFIADLPLYNDVKPFFLHPSALATKELDLSKIQITNVEWDKQKVAVHSMRNEPDLSLERNGFCYVKHRSNHLPEDGTSRDMSVRYCKEGEEFLKAHFDADLVKNYDFKVCSAYALRSLY